MMENDPPPFLLFSFLKFLIQFWLEQAMPPSRRATPSFADEKGLQKVLFFIFFVLTLAGPPACPLSLVR